MKYFRNVFCLCLVAIVPFGYYANDNDSSHVRIDGGVGTGTYLSVLRSCEDIRDKRVDHFEDIGADISYRPAHTLPFVLGIRGGHMKTSLDKVIYAYYPSSTKASFNNGYINPYVSIETRYVGLGAGWGRNLGPEFPPDMYESDFDFRQNKDYASTHIRVGPYSTVYAMMSFCEGVPIASQYGYLLLGVGGSIGRWHLIGGYSGGPYDGPGGYLGISHDTERYGRPSLSFRAGSTEGEFEGAINLGWSWPVY